jgi:hypothetical protein
MALPRSYNVELNIPLSYNFRSDYLSAHKSVADYAQPLVLTRK